MKKIIILAIFFGILSIDSAKSSSEDPSITSVTEIEEQPRIVNNLTLLSNEILNIPDGEKITANNIILDGGIINIYKGGELEFYGKFIAKGDWAVAHVSGAIGTTYIYLKKTDKKLGDRLKDAIHYVGTGDPSEAFLELT